MAKGRSLEDILKDGTDAVNASVSDFQPEVQPLVADPKPKEDDFIEEPEVTEESSEPELSEPARNALAAESAIELIETFDGLQRLYFPTAYKKTILKPTDIEIISELKKQKDFTGKSLNELCSVDERFYDALKRFDEYTERVDAIQFTQEEKDRLAVPLTRCIKKWSTFQMSPEMSLVITATLVMLPRLEPMLPQVFKGFRP